MKLAITFIVLGLTFASNAQPPVAPRVDIDWQKFLGQHDLVWEQLPRQWNEGAFVGNGQLGMMVYASLKDNRLDFHLGRQDVTDHRKAPDRKTSMGVKGASVFWDFPDACFALRAEKAVCTAFRPFVAQNRPLLLDGLALITASTAAMKFSLI